MELNLKNYDITSVQRGIFFESLVNLESNFYSIQSIYKLKGIFNLKNLLEAARFMAEKHPIFRSRFFLDHNGTPKQSVVENYKISYQVFENYSSKPIEEYLIEDRKIGFDLEEGRLIRGTIIKESEQSFTLIFSYHHILLDGWSAGLAKNEFFSLYDRLNLGEQLDFENIKPNNIFLNFCNKISESENEDKEYWEQLLNDYKPYSIKELSEYPNSTSDTHQHNFKLPVNFSLKLLDYAKKKRFTNSTITLALYFYFLNTVRGIDDICVGLVTSGRELDEIQDLETAVGCMMKTIPIRVTNIKSKSFYEICNELQNKVLFSIYNSNSSLTAYNNFLGKNKFSDNLFNELYLYENYPVEEIEYRTFSIDKNYAIDKNSFPSVTYFCAYDSNIEVEFQVHSPLSKELATYQITMIELVDSIIENFNSIGEYK
ncbi:hypothetical protein A5881_003617 [Enterococcus termitis]